MGLVKNEWIEAEARGWSAPDKHVCDHCVEDAHLKKVIKDNLAETCCYYCGRTSDNLIAAPVETVVEIIANTLFYFFSDPNQSGVPWDGGWIINPIDTDDALMELPLECHEDLFDDVVDSFIIDAWVPSADGHWMSSHQHEILRDSWHGFIEAVKYGSRFFFDHLPLSTTAGPQEFEPRYVLPTIGSVVSDNGLLKFLSKDQVLYRARERHPDSAWAADGITMGAPPSKMSKAGRMNPAGISYLYLSFEKQTALSEIVQSPPVNIVVGEFKLLQDIRVLDLSELPSRPSIFDTTNRKLYEGIIFLDNFVREISQSVHKDGREHIEYVPSQVVCEYFAQAFRPEAGNEEGSIQGIVYPSAIRRGGRNVVLFPSERGIERKFSVVEWVSASEIYLNDWGDLAREIL